METVSNWHGPVFTARGRGCVKVFTTNTDRYWDRDQLKLSLILKLFCLWNTGKFCGEFTYFWLNYLTSNFHLSIKIINDYKTGWLNRTVILLNGIAGSYRLYLSLSLCNFYISENVKTQAKERCQFDNRRDICKNFKHSPLIGQIEINWSSKIQEIELIKDLKIRMTSNFCHQDFI